MNIDLKGKVAVVSGGATLIGKAVVQALVSAGAHVAIFRYQCQRQGNCRKL